MDGKNTPEYRETFAIAIIYGVLVGCLAFIVTRFPGHLAGTLLDLSQKPELSSFVAEEFLTFLQISATRLTVFGAFGGLLSLVVFAVLWKWKSETIWLRGCILASFIMSTIAIPFLTIAEVYIRAKFYWPSYNHLLLQSDMIYSLLAAIPGLLCLVPVGLIMGLALQRLMKANRVPPPSTNLERINE